MIIAGWRELPGREEPGARGESVYQPKFSASSDQLLRLAYVLLGKVALKIAGIMKNAANLDYTIFALPINEEMSRLFHARTAESLTAERKMVGTGSCDQEFWPFHRSWPFWIRLNIEKRLTNQSLVARTRCLSELVETPFHNRDNISPGWTADVNFKAATFSQVCAR
jgi:hypothetical protein